MANIMTPSSRAKLPVRREPYWEQITVGRHIGFRAGAGSWVAKINQDGVRQICKLGDLLTLPDYKAALEAAHEFFAHVDSGGSAQQVTVKEAMERYIAGIRGGVAGRNKGVLNEEQREAKAKEVERFTKYSLGDLANKQLTTLKHVTVKRWREQLQQGRSPSSVNRIMTILRAGLNNALENRMVTNDMAWSLALKSIENVGSRRERYVTKDERRTLIENLREDFKPYVTLLCLLPLRPGDPERMLVKHYDPRSGTLTIPAGKTTIRRVSLSPQAEEVIRTACKGKLPGAYIFTQKNNNKWLKYSRREAVQNARTAAGFDNDVVLYAIRGSIITDMITGGTDPLTVARLSGTSLQMIQKHYGHLIDDRAREALARVSL